MGTINDGTIMWQTRDRRLTEQQKVIVDLIYPVGSIITTVSDTAPIPFGTWKEVGQGRVLQGCTAGQTAGNIMEAGLPNITGEINAGTNWGITGGGAVEGGCLAKGKSYEYVLDGNNSFRGYAINFNASRSSKIYGATETVQPPAYLVHFWQRIA